MHVPSDPPVGDVALSAERIEQRKAFLGFSPEDEALLVTLHDALEREVGTERFVDDFHAHLRSFPEPAALLADEERFARLRRSQVAYFRRLTAGRYDAKYVADRVRVGVANQRVGLAPEWYFGAYCHYFSLLLPRLTELSAGDRAHADRLTLALLKVVWLDVGLAVDAYIDAGQRIIRRHQAKLHALSEVAISLTSSLSPTEILDLIMRSAVDLSGSKGACVAFRDENTGAFEDHRTLGLSKEFVSQMVFRPGDPAHEVCATVDEVHVLSNDRPGTLHQLSRLARDEGIRSFLCLPLRSRGANLGAVYFYRSDRDVFDAEEIALLKTFSRLASEAIANTRSHARVEGEAGTDALTGLANRRTFDRRLGEEHRRTMRYGTPYTLGMIDIDRFKSINDTLGHPAGDAVLRQLGALLAGQFRGEDVVARYGGEEFVVILLEAKGEIGTKVLERAREAVGAMRFEVPEVGTVPVTVSIGVACAPRGGATAADLLRQADQALYAAKEGGRNQVRFSPAAEEREHLH